VESDSIWKAEDGSAYTIKQYSSEKKVDGDKWSHESIILKPLSYDKEYQNIELSAEDQQTLRVVGIFERVLV
jgi:hypothetical protein